MSTWKVMAADDEAYIRNALPQLIDWRRLNCELVYTAHNGKELIDAMEEAHPDIVITDIRMPLVDGLAVCKYVYEHCPEAQLIVLTAYSDFQYAKTALRYSACDYVLKPSIAEELSPAIEKAIALLEQGQNSLRDPQEMPPGQRSPDLLYSQIQQYVALNYRQSITLAQLAQAMHANPCYISRLYKSFSGVNLFDDILLRRIAKAKECLADPDWRVGEIAAYVGIQDSAYFSRVFKKQTGMSPMEYRHALSKHQPG